MARVREQKLVCSVCAKEGDLPECCGKTMEDDGEFFFCANCNREIKTPVCCRHPMQIRNRLRDIKKEIFGKEL